MQADQLQAAEGGTARGADSQSVVVCGALRILWDYKSIRADAGNKTDRVHVFPPDVFLFNLKPKTCLIN